MLFSQRKKLTPIRVDIQREEVDERLRNKIWSAIQVIFFEAPAYHFYHLSLDDELIIKHLWMFFFHRPIDTAPVDRTNFRAFLRAWFFKANWYEVYDFVEALYAEVEGHFRTSLSQLVNSYLESEMAAYRLIDGQISEITNEQEIASIEDSLRDTTFSQPVQTHLREALAKLTDRTQPDYRNSIKESISAVEALCQVITANKRATLGQAIGRLKDGGVHLHPALESAWSKLYGYTSDGGGIRHALSDEPNVGFSDAKYMFVSCSAFINHLLDLSRSAGVKLD
jgi:hypothetical protein